jgi:hypothetical protein
MDIGVLGEDYSSEWDSIPPAYEIPKKHRAGTITVVNDFRYYSNQPKIMLRMPFLS